MHIQDAKRKEIGHDPTFESIAFQMVQTHSLLARSYPENENQPIRLLRLLRLSMFWARPNEVADFIGVP